MYGNNLGGPFMMPNMMNGPVMMNNIPYGSMMGTMGTGLGRGGLSRLATGGLFRGRGILSGIKGINWSGMLGNASKALGVVNQAIPIVKEVGPMMNNMRSMLKIASVFKDETDGKQQETSKEKIISSSQATEKNTKNEVSNNSSTIISDENKPNFFI